MEVQINKELCKGCGICIPVCPTGAISLVDGVAEVNHSLCTRCQACLNACPTGAISISELPVRQESSAVQVVPEQATIINESVLQPPARRLSFVLSSIGSVLLPRLATIFMDALERHYLQGGNSSPYTPFQNPILPMQHGGRGFRRRIRGGGQR